MASAALTTVAEAADHPLHQAAPIEYARICDASGAGFFVIPGSNRCLRAGGFLPGKTGGLSVRSTAQGQSAIVDKSLIQFAGLTSGRAQFLADSYADADTNLRGQDAVAKLLAYTATFGGGFSSLVSLEDSPSRPETSGSRIVTSIEAPFGVARVGGTSPRGKPVEARISEIVGNLRLDQPWGGEKLSGTAQAQQTSQFQAKALPTIAPLPSPSGISPPFPLPALTSNPHGFTLQDGVQANRDYLSPGDKLWLQAAYEKGASPDLAGKGSANADSSVSQSLTPVSKFALGTYSAGSFPQINFNCIFAGSSKCEQQSRWDITGAYKNYWLPILKSKTFGSTLEVRNQGDASTAIGSVAGGSNLKEARIEQNLFRSPLRGFDIGADYMYAHLSQARPAAPAMDSGVTAGGLPGFGPNPDAYEGRLRVQHGF